MSIHNVITQIKRATQNGGYLSISQSDGYYTQFKLGTTLTANADITFPAYDGDMTLVRSGSIAATELGVTAGTVAASKAVVVDSNKDVSGFRNISNTGTLGVGGVLTASALIKPDAANGADSANGLLIGVGTSGDPSTTSDADKNFLEFRTESTATSGDSRGGYFRHALNGAGGSGESLRANTNLYDAAVANAHGVHASIAHQSSAALTGLGVGGRFGWILPDAAVAAGGTYYAGMSEIYVSGDSSDPSSVTQYAVHHFGVTGTGNATAKAKVKNMFAFTGEDGSGDIIYTNAADPGNAAGSIRVLINGTAKYLKFWDSE